MKFKNSILILFFFIFITQAQSETNGYLSFEYTKGQDESGISWGTFQNVQFGLIFSGEIAPKIDYTSEMRFRNESKIEMEQAYLRIKPSESFSLKLGLYLVPFGRYNSSNRPYQTMLVKPPLNVENLFPLSWRDIGVLVEGKLSGFFYSAYLGNGLAESKDLSTAQQFKDNNKDKAKGLRIGLSLSQGLEVAFSYYRGKYDEGNERNLILKGVDLRWISEGFQLLSEYSKAEMENPTSFFNGNAEGYFVQISFDMDKFRPVGSYQLLKYKDIYHGEDFIARDYGGQGIRDERSRWTVGLVYFVSQNVFFKVEYELNREKEVELKNNLLLIQIALNF